MIHVRRLICLLLLSTLITGSVLAQKRPRADSDYERPQARSRSLFAGAAATGTRNHPRRGSYRRLRLPAGRAPYRKYRPAPGRLSASPGRHRICCRRDAQAGPGSAPGASAGPALDPRGRIGRTGGVSRTSSGKHAENRADRARRKSSHSARGNYGRSGRGQ